MSSDVTIQLKNVNKAFRTVHAVQNLSFDVPRGSLIGFLGPNGAGKSTTIRMIMSIIYPDQGQIEVLGDTALAAKDRIGYLPEERGLYRKMRVGEYLKYVGRLKGMERRDAASGTLAWLDRMELGHVNRKKCEELSKGMQQKIQFIASVIHEPDLLILDEPFSGLDPVNAELLNGVIADLHAQGRTIIFSTHVLHQAEQLCDRILLIDRGEMILDDTMDGIRQTFDPRTIQVETIPGSALPESIGGVSERTTSDEEGVELHLDPSTDPHDVMTQILQNGPVRSIRLRRPSLDEIFVMLVRDRVHETRTEFQLPGLQGMSKIPNIAWREFKHTALTKAFIIGSIVVPVLCLPVFIVLPALLKTEAEPLVGTVVIVGPDSVVNTANALTQEHRGTATQEAMDMVLDQLPEGTMDPMTTQMASSMTGTRTSVELVFESGTADELDAMKAKVRKSDLLATVTLRDGILLPQPQREQNKFQVFVRPGLSANHLELISDFVSDAVVQTRVATAGMEYGQLHTMMRSPRSETLRLQQGGGEAVEYQWAKRLIPAAFMFLVWIATFTSGNYLLTSTIEEKSNKVIEVLLSAVSPFQLMAGKILGQAIVSLVTLAMYGGLGIAALFALSQSDLVPISMLLWMLLFFGMAYFMIAAIMASVGSAVSDLHDAQSLIGPAMLVLMLPLVLWMPISEAPNGMLAMVTSWIPPLIPFIMILRVTASGDPVPLWQILGTLVAGYAFVVMMIWFCARIFRVGVLMQGKAPSPWELIKWVRYK